MVTESEKALARLCDEIGGFQCTGLHARKFQFAVDVEHSRILSHGKIPNGIAVTLTSISDLDSGDVYRDYSLQAFASQKMLEAECVLLSDLVESPDHEALLRRATCPRWSAETVCLTLPSSRGFVRIFERGVPSSFDDFCTAMSHFQCSCPAWEYKGYSRESYELCELVCEDDLKHMWGVFQGTKPYRPLL